MSLLCVYQPLPSLLPSSLHKQQLFTTSFVISTEYNQKGKRASDCGCDRKLFNLSPTNVVRISKTREMLKSNNDVDKAQSCAESGPKLGEKHSFLNTDL